MVAANHCGGHADSRIGGGIQVARGQVDDPSGYVINIFWGGVNIAAMLPLIFAAMWTPAEEDEVTQ